MPRWLGTGRTWLSFLALWGLLLGSGSQVRGDEDHYELKEQYVGEGFYDKWSFYTGKDPTNGIVDFVDWAEAKAKGMISASWDRVFMGVDSTTTLWGNNGRAAVKLLSNSVYNNGLFVLRADHVPTACGAWPAWWMFGEDSHHAWPRWGEYDIMEAVHKQPYASTTLHTREHCDQRPVNSGLDFDGQGWSVGSNGMAPAKDCNVHAPGEFPNQGCGQKMPDGSFGPGLNQNGGATWAAEWDPARHHIRTWFFPNGQEPEDLASHKPRPEFWGIPTSFFTLDPRFCSAGHFKNMRMVFDTTFCGDYGNPTFASSCPGVGMSCNDFVQKKPEEFAEAYWSIRGLDVYQRPGYATLEAKPMEPSRGSPSSPGWAWFMLGLFCSGIGVGALFVVRIWPAQKMAKSRGLGQLDSGGSMPGLSDCLDLNADQLSQGELRVQSGSMQRLEQDKYAERAPSGHFRQSPSPPSPQNSGFLGKASRWILPQQFQQQQQPQYMERRVSSGNLGSPSRSVTTGPQAFWRGIVGAGSPGQQQVVTPVPSGSGSPMQFNTGSAPSFYGPGTGAGAGAGSWGSFIVNGVGGIVQAASGAPVHGNNPQMGGAYGGAYGGSQGQYGVQPTSQRADSLGYTLPPTINALQPGLHAPQGYMPVQRCPRGTS